MFKTLMLTVAVLTSATLLASCGDGSNEKENAINKAQQQATDQYNKDVERRNTVRSQIR